jgi:hypothetical protein
VEENKPENAQPVDVENVESMPQSDEQSNVETVDKRPLPDDGSVQALPDAEPEQNPNKGVQTVHVVDEDPEEHMGAETKDPWVGEGETDWVQPGDKSSE